MSTATTLKLMSDLDECRKNSSTDYLDWDWDAIATEIMGTSYNPSTPSVFIDRLMGGYYGFKKYEYDRQLCQLLEKCVLNGDQEAINVLEFYVSVQFHKGFAAQSLGRLKVDSAAPLIAEQLLHAVSEGPQFVTYLDQDGITLSPYTMMIEAIKTIGIKDDYIEWALNKCIEKSLDPLIKRDAEDALTSLNNM